MRHKKMLIMIMAVSLMNLSAGCGKAAAKQQEPQIQAEQEEKNKDGNYNIIFITVDQEHYFEEYPDGTDYKARALLKSMGTTFEKHYACSNMSTSSRSVIYTGTHVNETKMIDNTDFPWQDAMSQDITTIGDLMNEAGYYSAYKGKFHLEDASVLVEKTEPELQQQDGLLGYGFADWNAEGDLSGAKLQGYSDDYNITANSVKWLRTKGATLNKEENQPFFLSVNLINPHDIMYYNTDSPGEEVQEKEGSTLKINRAPEDAIYSKTYDITLPQSWNEPMDAPGRVPAHAQYTKQWGEITGVIPPEEERWKKFSSYYYNCIQDNDNSLWMLLQELQNLDMLKNTILVFTSDHGENDAAHGLWGKGGFMYENNIHVPLVIVHPEYAGGKSIEAVTSHIDLAPTLIDMTSIEKSEKERLSANLKGKSMIPLLEGSATKIREGSLFVFDMISMVDYPMINSVFQKKADPQVIKIKYENRNLVRGITTEKYKFARYFSPLSFHTPTTLEALYANNDVELFDLENDPDEMHNLAADKEKNKDLILEMKS